MKKAGNIWYPPTATAMCGGILIAKLLLRWIPPLSAYRKICIIVCALLSMGICAVVVIRWWKTLPEDEPLPAWAVHAWVGSAWGCVAFYIMQLMDIFAQLPETWTTLAIAAPVICAFAGFLYGKCKQE